MNELNAAIDIGGTKIAIGLGHPTGEIVDSVKLPTEPEIGPEAIVENLMAALSDLVRVNDAKLLSIGVGSPSPIDVEKGTIMSPSNLRDWIDVPIVGILKERFGVPVQLENDANAAALGEYRFGAGRGFSDLLYVTVSTGIGGGIIINGEVLHGVCTAAGEIGHTIVDPDGVRCNCGSRGCLETISSGTHIARRATERLASGKETILREVGVISAKAVAEAVKKGDRVATEIWDETCRYLSIGIANAISLLAPQVVVIGGGIAMAGEILFSRIREYVPEYVSMVPRSKINIVPAELGANSGLVGALAVACRPSGSEVFHYAKK